MVVFVHDAMATVAGIQWSGYTPRTESFFAFVEFFLAWRKAN